MICRRFRVEDDVVAASFSDPGPHEYRPKTAGNVCQIDIKIVTKI